MGAFTNSVVVTVATGYFHGLGFGSGFALWLALYTLLTTVVPFAYNAYNARRVGLPVIYLPLIPHAIWWMVVQVPASPMLERWLPTWLWKRLSLTVYCWEFHQKMRPFDEFALPQGNRKSFNLVAFSYETEVSTWDPEFVMAVLSRPQDFEVQALTQLFMDGFGKNVLTSNGEMWSRQRRIVAGVINEKISKAIFNETVQQTRELLNEVFEKQEQQKGAPAAADTTKMFDMMKKVTIHVLSAVGMGVSAPWGHNGLAGNVKPGFSMDFMTAVKTVTLAVGGPIILPRWFLHNYPSAFPGAAWMHQIAHAVDEFPRHLQDKLNEERARNQASKSGELRGNIMSQLLRASEAEGAVTRSGAPGLSESEMTGNLFIFTVAGFDTTANTLSFSLMLLARHPEWQDWLFEEANALIPTGVSAAELEYAEIHPKATRMLALMLETLRLFPPIIHLPKQTNGPQTVQTSHGPVYLPDQSMIYINVVCLHLDPDVWRNLNLDTAAGEVGSDDDEHKFRPSRWINSDGTAFQPPKGLFVPWSYGPRVCPGMKMAQVEFVAVMLTMLQGHKIYCPPLSKDETRAQVEDRLDKQMKNSISKLTLEMQGVYDMGEGAGFTLGLEKRN